MSFPNENPEASAHEAGLISLLRPIAYLDPNNGGGGIVGARVPREAIDWSAYSPPAIVIVFTGTVLGSRSTEVIGGCVFDEEFHFELYAVNASFDVAGSGRLGGVLEGDPGSFPLITDIRTTTYGKTFEAFLPWANSGPGPRIVKVFPSQPPVQRWDIAPKDDPNKIVYRLNVRNTWLINGG